MAVQATRVRRRALLGVAAVLALTAVVIAPENRAASLATLPPGWRWESFGGVEVGVPGDWGWGNGSQRIGQWCVGWTVDRAMPPVVGRPWGSTLAGCGPDVAGSPRPETLMRNTGQIVAFDLTTPLRDGSIPGDSTTSEGDSLLIRRHGVDVTIIAAPALRRQIAGTVHLVDVDANGCPTADPISADPARRPAVVPSTERLGEVRSVSICQYMLTRLEVGSRPPGTPAPTPEPGTNYVSPEPRLLASARMTGEQARKAIGGIASSPLGSGPNRPQNCSADYQYGSQAIVLRVQRAVGQSQIIYFRFDGCNHHGFDDGTTVHRLTVSTANAFLVEGVTVDAVDSSLAGLIRLG
jgi:hypothetical protein